MAKTPQKSWRPTDDDLARIGRLAARWGPVVPLSESDVIRTALRLCEEQILGAERREKKRQKIT